MTQSATMLKLGFRYAPITASLQQITNQKLQIHHNSLVSLSVLSALVVKKSKAQTIQTFQSIQTPYT